MDKFTLGIYLGAIVLAVLFMRFSKSSKKKTAGSGYSSDPNSSSPTSSRGESPTESTMSARRVDEDSLFSHAETNIAENALLGGVIHPSPIEREKQVDFARPLLQPIGNSTNLFDADKIDDLTRPWGEQVASEPTNLLELDKKHDLTRPWNEE